MSTTHSLEDLKHYHNEAIQFFGSELILLKEVVPKIVNERLAEAAVLLMSCGQTGAALLILANQTEIFSSASVILARAFMEGMTNFCYVSICDEKEYRAFVLHPIYKYFHSVADPKIEDDFDFDLIAGIVEAKKEKQRKLNEIPIVQEALTIFSETNSHLNWTKKTLDQRIATLAKWGKFLDFIFSINKYQYYSDASEILHGSLYGCTYNVGVFDPDFDHTNKEELHKKIYKDSTCVLLHLGMLIHESFTLISYKDDITEQWKYSYNNRNNALNLLFHVLEKKPSKLKKNKP